MSENETRHGARIVLITGPRDLLKTNAARYDNIGKLLREYHIDKMIILAKGEKIDGSRIKELREQHELGRSSMLIADLLESETQEVYEDLLAWAPYKRPMIILEKEQRSESFSEYRKQVLLHGVTRQMQDDEIAPIIPIWCDLLYRPDVTEAHREKMILARIERAVQYVIEVLTTIADKTRPSA